MVLCARLRPATSISSLAVYRLLGLQCRNGSRAEKHPLMPCSFYTADQVAMMKLQMQGSKRPRTDTCWKRAAKKPTTARSDPARSDIGFSHLRRQKRVMGAGG